jgi:type VI secretion system protein ImpJ
MHGNKPRHGWLFPCKRRCQGDAGWPPQNMDAKTCSQSMAIFFTVLSAENGRSKKDIPNGRRIMKLLSRVVWSEGMYLAPHHFQTQSRYFEDSITFLTQSLRRDCWGLLQVGMDRKAVENGRSSLLHAAGFFPDGLAFDIPISDEAPIDRDLIGIFPATATELRLFLAVSKRNGESDAGVQNDNPRYSRRPRIFRDETNGVDEQNVELAGKNIRILAESELTPAMLSLPLARVLRDERGRFVYDDEFVPPCLRISASDSLLGKLQQVLEVVGEKSASIAQNSKSASMLTLGASQLDVVSYWFLHSLQSAIPVLRHLLQTSHAHPAECFAEYVKLAGALCTFAVDTDPRTLPVYDHRDPGPAFDALCTHIRRHLEILLPSNTIELSFSAAGPYMHKSAITDERCLRRARWILGMHSSLGESELMRAVPRLVKLCSARFVPELVKRALPGMTLTHLSTPPGALRSEPDVQYFSVDTAGACWEHILHTRTVGIYIPGEIADAEFTLTAIVEAQV